MSLHSSSKNDELKAFCSAMYNTTGTVTDDCWIGFTDSTTEGIWIWSDNTTADYGTDISGGVYPWASGEPNGDDCARLQSIPGTYDWADSSCTLAKHFFCNDCNLTLSKYIVVDSILTQTAANTYCRDTYGTELATIQSEDDFQDAILLCSYVDDDCWIGLFDYNTEDTWEWEDGTDNVDFFSVYYSYPWVSGEPNNFGGNEDCVQLSPLSFLANDQSCTFTAKFLCNSALDNYICDINVQRDLWNEISCTWSWNSKVAGCGVTLSESTAGCVIWLGDSSGTVPYKMWTDMVVEVTFSFMNDESALGTAGILLRAQNVNASSGGQQYYIALAIASNEVQLVKFDDGYTLLTSASVSFTITPDVYYNLRCELFGNTFNIYVEGDLYITHNDSSFDYGSVALRTDTRVTIYKKLFIAGVEYIPSLAPTSQPTSSTLQPTTRIPSLSPTVPTRIPTFPEDTMFPTRSPSVSPSSQPSIEPTVNPTENPTHIPTFHPFSMPTIEPTVYPTIDPVIYPSYNPTFDPSLHPTQNPATETTEQPRVGSTSSAGLSGTAIVQVIVGVITSVVVFIAAMVIYYYISKRISRRKRERDSLWDFTPGGTTFGGNTFGGTTPGDNDIGNVSRLAKVMSYSETPMVPL